MFYFPKDDTKWEFHNNSQIKPRNDLGIPLQE
jgi:hypothetical protein